MNVFVSHVLCAGSILLLALGSLKAEVSQVDFATDIRPIFKEHCYRCHGSTQQKAGLRLNLGGSEAPFEGDTGAAWQAGDADASLLVSLIRGEHEDIAAMPYKAESLPNPQIEQIARWIDQGALIPSDLPADEQDHWAFVAASRPDIPQVRETTWPRNPIDSFILHRLETEGMTPSPEASPHTLMRRLFLDLTGLPPG